MSSLFEFLTNVYQKVRHANRKELRLYIGILVVLLLMAGIIIVYYVKKDDNPSGIQITDSSITGTTYIIQNNGANVNIHINDDNKANNSTSVPTQNPVTQAPTKAPTKALTKAPTKAPTNTPTRAPTPTPKPTPTHTPKPTVCPPIPNIGSKVFGLNAFDDSVSWVQKQLKATGIWYQDKRWRVSGHVGQNTVDAIKDFMRSRGKGNHSGSVDQSVINELYNYLCEEGIPIQQ